MNPLEVLVGVLVFLGLVVAGYYWFSYEIKRVAREQAAPARPDFIEVGGIVFPRDQITLDLRDPEHVFVYSQGVRFGFDGEHAANLRQAYAPHLVASPDPVSGASAGGIHAVEP